MYIWFFIEEHEILIPLVEKIKKSNSVFFNRKNEINFQSKLERNKKDQKQVKRLIRISKVNEW